VLNTNYQTGSGLVEQLIALLLFSIGILGLMSMQATAVNHASDAQYRAEASLLANQIIGIMWTDRVNLTTYQHNPVGPACTPTASATGNANALAWLAGFTSADNASYLPGATSVAQQISIDANRIVEVTVCWKLPQDDDWQNYTVSSQIPV
jgi:type IV pilus assembly protein PilV